MKKRFALIMSFLVVLVGVLVGVKALQIRMMTGRNKVFVPPPEVVTTAPVLSQSWESTLGTVGTLTAVQGVEVAAEAAGKVVRIDFTPGSRVKAGDPLVQQDVAAEAAQLRAAETAAELARINLERSRSLVARGTIALSSHDSAETQYQQARAQIDNLKAIIARKVVRAPFAGRLGIRQVNLGQFLKEGAPIVTLQSLDPIYVNFLLPQQKIATVSTGLPVRLTTDALPGQIMTASISTINPEIDSASRNFRVQALAPNPGEQLRPGMFVEVSIVLPGERTVLAIPATAVLHAPYSDSVFVVEQKTDEKTGATGTVLRQQFIRTGDRRGDFAAVTEGLKEGDIVVSTGVFKLRNGQSAVVDNSLNPEFRLAPEPREG